MDLIFIVQGALFTECVFESFRSDLEKVDVNVTSAFSVKSVTQELFDMKCLSSCTDNGLCINGISYTFLFVGICREPACGETPQSETYD